MTRGRPILPDGQRRVKLSTSVGADMRAAIDDECARSGRSMAQVVELWLEQARVLHALRLQHPGGIGAHGLKPKTKKPLDAIQGHFAGFLPED